MINLASYLSGKQVRHSTGYTYFMPSHINDQWLWDNPEINSLLEKAATKLGELNSFSKLVPSIDLFLRLHITKEAVVSSRIEGTKTQMDEALSAEEDIAPERKNDWQEVTNYVKALQEAILALDTLPISARLIRNTHGILLDSVRGEHKQPGEFRKSQNWIGGISLSDASFIPPSYEFIPELMSDLESFLHNTDIQVPVLIKIGIAHYQFETIHPFLDGNGRIGRLLIPLFLVDQKILDKPLLYISAFFEKDKSLYYDNLTLVRTKSDMTHWLKYFLVGLVDTAENAIQTLTQVIELKTKLEGELAATFGKRSQKGHLLLQYLFENPVTHVKLVKSLTSTSFKAANDLVNAFVEAGILKEMTGKNRNRLFVFDAYVQLF